MAPRQRTRLEIIDMLARAAEEAQRAEVYHKAARDPRTLEGRGYEAACDAAAMQLIELIGCGEKFIPDRGDPGTTLARVDDALRPMIRTRMGHAHPELGILPPAPFTPRDLDGMMKKLKEAIENLDRDTLRIQPSDQRQALNGIYLGITWIERDGFPNAATLRPRDLHYAGYYREIQFARLAKETGLFVDWNARDARRVDVNRCIFDADDMAHKFHAMRGGPDKSILPVSVVAPQHRDRVPGRVLSELLRELRRGFQKSVEQIAELDMIAKTRGREERRDAIKGLAQTYARMTGDEKAGAAVDKYMQGRGAGLDRDAIEGLRQGLEIAASAPLEYRELPKTVQDRCVDMCLALFEEQADSRLLDIVDAAERAGEIEKRETMYDRFPGVTLDEGEKPELGLDPDPDLERGTRRR
jgi:hypothetical protein